MKDILPKHVLYCKQLQIACKLHEINTAVLKVDVLEVPKQDGRSVLYETSEPLVTYSHLKHGTLLWL